MQLSLQATIKSSKVCLRRSKKRKLKPSIKAKTTPNLTTISIMNLLDKSLGQLALLAVALFFFSCEDPTSIGFPNPNDKFDIHTIEIPLETSTILVDSVITDNKTLRDGVTLVGKYQ